MAKCDYCEREMLKTVGCDQHDYILKDGTKVPAQKVGEEGWVDVGERCGDCGAKHGSYHHHGCDIERCPICHGQMIMCDCNYKAEMVFYKEVKETPAQRARRLAVSSWNTMGIEERKVIATRATIPVAHWGDKKKVLEACLKVIMQDMKEVKSK